MLHPEAGHINVKPHKIDEDFDGVCPFHGRCLEGMVSNKSIAKRKNIGVHDLPYISDEDPVWEALGTYLAELCMNLTFIASPEVILIGGGVMKRGPIMKTIREKFSTMVNGYLKTPQL